MHGTIGEKNMRSRNYANGSNCLYLFLFLSSKDLGQGDTYGTFQADDLVSWHGEIVLRVGFEHRSDSPLRLERISFFRERS